MQIRERKAVRLRPRSVAPRVETTRETLRYAVFTSVDGSLLDALTFDPGPARSMIRRLRANDVALVPMTVMTLDEIAPIAAELGLTGTMVIEAGGAIARWNGEAWDVEPCGPPADTILDVVLEVEQRSGADLLVYSAMTAADAARLSGRRGEMLAASTHRRFSEPFVIERGSLADVQSAAASLGFIVREGSRFLHLCRECDDGEAFTRLRNELQCDVAIALGRSPLDAEFLSRAEIAIVLPDASGKPNEELVASVPHARIAPASGPKGWALALAEVLPAISAGRRSSRRSARAATRQPA